MSVNFPFLGTIVQVGNARQEANRNKQMRIAKVSEVNLGKRFMKRMIGKPEPGRLYLFNRTLR